MIYANAETAQDIARLLRSAQEPIVITAPRRSYKTTELLKFAEEKNSNGKFAMVCLSDGSQKLIIRRHWEIFNRISQADIVAKRLLGEPLGGIDINPPLVVTPDNINLLRGTGRPVFVDEWHGYAEKTQNFILESGLFVAAVTSSRA